MIAGTSSNISGDSQRGAWTRLLDLAFNAVERAGVIVTPSEENIELLELLVWAMPGQLRHIEYF